MSLFPWFILVALIVVECAVVWAFLNRFGYLELVMEMMMSDTETLTEKLTAISQRVDSVAVDMQTLKDQLEEIHQGGEVDLTDAINTADSILSRLTSLDESVGDPVPAIESDDSDVEEPADPADVTAEEAAAVDDEEV